jgi:hypothetical protein
MKAALITHFRHPIAGREKLALDYGAEVNDYWGKLAADGKCTFPEFFFSTTGGWHLWMVKGDLETLEEIQRAPETQTLLHKGSLLLENFGSELHLTGETADEYMLRFAETAQGYGLF